MASVLGSRSKGATPPQPEAPTAMVELHYGDDSDGAPPPARNVTENAFVGRSDSRNLLGSAKNAVVYDLVADEPGEEFLPGDNPSLNATDKEMTPMVHLITSVLVAFSLGSKDTPHFFFAFIVLLQFFFCFVEARRTTYYVLVRSRCRLMERGMYAHILEPTMPAVNWRRPLRDSYMPGVELMSSRRSFLLRVKRLYVYLILATYMGWTFKLVTMMEVDQTTFLWQAFAPVSAVVFLFAFWVIVFVKENAVDV